MARRTRWLWPAIALAAASSCSGRLPVDVAGSLSEGVTFTLNEDRHGAGFRRLLIEQRPADDRPRDEDVMWDVRGDGSRVMRIVYGELPAGATQSAPARALEAGRSYRIQASGELSRFDAMFGPRHVSGLCEFDLSPAGRVVSGPGCDAYMGR